MDGFAEFFAISLRLAKSFDGRRAFHRKERKEERNKDLIVDDCLFCRIVAGEIPAKKVLRRQHTFAFEDIDPKAPTHVLVVPKKHIRGLKEA